ncbi:MAG: nucleotidyl transferase AbiEii/AbiGii toxin family protein [Planctomycetes bacterium]|nr:nucleotidyl transferase AbiEii/AbiGii toxin family protein [Planctomycetota bacterium]
MSNPRPTDMAASVRQKLLNLAKKIGDDFNLVLTRYGNERLLYRLSRSPDGQQFVLKGATLFLLWSAEVYRPTKDIDLLGQGDNSPDALAAAFRRIVAVEVEDDGLIFDAKAIKAAPIGIEAEYRGVRVTIPAKLGAARLRLQVDVGFGDAVTPPPKVATLPTLLSQPAPKLKAYSMDTVVAEKFHAMVDLGLTNSRMKDFFDIWVLATTFEFEGSCLHQAIKATFTRRQTAVPQEVPLALTDQFAKDSSKQRQWKAFIGNTAPKHRDMTLDDVVQAVRAFVMPVVRSIKEAKGFSLVWRSKGTWKAASPG